MNARTAFLIVCFFGCLPVRLTVIAWIVCRMAGYVVQEWRKAA